MESTAVVARGLIVAGCKWLNAGCCALSEFVVRTIQRKQKKAVRVSWLVIGIALKCKHWERKEKEPDTDFAGRNSVSENALQRHNLELYCKKVPEGGRAFVFARKMSGAINLPRAVFQENDYTLRN
jgi:hypothetical protein